MVSDYLKQLYMINTLKTNVMLYVTVIDMIV